MNVDEDEDSIDRSGVHEPEEDVRSMIQSCKFTMKMKMTESAGKQVRSHLCSSVALWELPELTLFLRLL